MYEVLVSHEAEKYYKKQNRNTKRKLNKCIDDLGKEPLLDPHIKRLHGKLEGKYRYKIGNIRVVYEVDIKNKIVEIKSIGGRGDVYKRQFTVYKKS